MSKVTQAVCGRPGIKIGFWSWSQKLCLPYFAWPPCWEDSRDPASMEGELPKIQGWPRSGRKPRRGSGGEACRGLQDLSIQRSCSS